MRVTCKHCGGAHPAFECRKKKSGANVALASNDRVHDPAAIHLTVQPKASVAAGRVGQKSTAPRKDEARHGTGSTSRALTRTDDRKRASGEAGTQALLVDTNTPMPSASGAREGKDELASTQKQLIDVSSEKASQGFKSPAGQTKFDKKAWMRSKMPAYMRQYRSDVKAGLRIPKPKASKPIQ